jgi:ribulose-phosphate 3-epimerase
VNKSRTRRIVFAKPVARPASPPYPVAMALTPLICPSILASDFARLGEEVRALEAAGADWIHVDVMDGHFVPNITLGPDIVKAIRPHTSLPFDVHLMVAPVDPWLEAYRDAGADLLTVHPESGPHLHRTLGRIRQLGAKAGVVFNPATPLSILEEVVDLVDLVLIMSVNPGFGGQKFIDSSLRKIAGARAILDRAGSTAHLQVDGGVTSANAAACVAAGADALVAGSFVFKGDYATNIAALKAVPAAA